MRAPSPRLTVGCDVVEIARFARVLARNHHTFLDTLFTPAERARGESPEQLAACLAVKEAALKAIGTGLVGGVAMTDVEALITGDRCELRLSGAPAAILRARAAAAAARVWIADGHAHALVRVDARQEERP